jgi:hypothetical protein
MSVTPRRALTVVALAALVATCVEPRFLQMPFIDRDAHARRVTAFPDAQWPQYPRFLEGVRAHTRPGDQVALIVPVMEWDGGYSYGYYRASYFLTGREVLPVVDPRNRALPRNFESARYVAAFGVNLAIPGVVAWSGEGGTLYRR